MMHRRSSCSGLAAFILCLQPLGAMAQLTPPLTILTAVANTDTRTVTVTGSNFGNTSPSLLLAGQRLAVLSFDPLAQRVTATLPGVQAGTYKLVVRASDGRQDSLGLTIGTAGPTGPAGPPGPAGPSGDACSVIPWLPYTVNQPGSYCLDRTYFLDQGSPLQALIINAAGPVSVDLRGFAIVNIGTAAGGSQGIIISSDSAHVRNGEIRGFYRGIWLVANDGVIENMDIVSSTQDGIRADGNANTIRNNNVYGIAGTAAPDGDVCGIGAYGMNSTVLGNTIRDIHSPDSDVLGINLNACDYCRVEGNQISNTTLANGYGIQGGGSQGTMIINNRVLHMPNGIDAYLADGIIYADNITFGCTVPYGQGINGGNNR